MRIEKNNIILQLEDSEDTFELNHTHLMIDYDNIEGDFSVAPLILYKIGKLKTSIDTELAKLERELEKLFYEKCRGRRVNKSSFPNSNGLLSPSYPTNNQQVYELVYSDKEYQEKRVDLENKKEQASIVSNYFFAFKEKCKKLDILCQRT